MPVWIIYFWILWKLWWSFNNNITYTTDIAAFLCLENINEKQDELLEDALLALQVASSLRYGVLLVHHSVSKWEKIMVDILPFVDQNRFRQIVRLGWENFDYLYGLIKGHAVFQGPRAWMQFPVAVQLIIVLYRPDSSGEGSSVAKLLHFCPF